MKKILLMAVLTLLMTNVSCTSGRPRKIADDKECPLCGMYPARYPQFNCQIVFDDGSYAAFDSASGLLVYLHFPDKTGIEVKPVARIYFKDYYRENWIESEKTFFVMGSEIMGPMGVEFLAVDSETAAGKLQKQQAGREIVPFKTIDRLYMVTAAKAGWLHHLARNLVLK